MPVGVLRQISGKPHVRYRVLGLALVSGWEGGYFFLEGFAPSGVMQEPGPQTEIESLLDEPDVAQAIAAAFNPTGVIDARKKILAAITQRHGQHEFRRQLLEAYGRRCAISGCDVPEALEGAHIIPYRGPETNHPANGLLLRADLHTLFDLGLIAIDSTTMRLIISPRLENTVYHNLAGAQLGIPTNPASQPHPLSLDQHRAWTGL